MLLLAIAVAFSAIMLAPEVSIGRLTVNDQTFHLAASERLAQSIANREPFMDPWVSEWALGYPFWRSYQPFPHLVAAAVLSATQSVTSHAQAFAILNYILMLLMPVSAYFGARLIGIEPLAAGFASLLVWSTAARDHYADYGLGYGAIVWRGSGLYTQLFALDVLFPSLGLTARAIDTGRNRIAAALGLALTSLSHIVFGYVIFASAGVWTLAGTRAGLPKRLARLAIVGGLALILIAWFVVPMFLVRHEINRSHWDQPFVFDSFGAPAILRELFSGHLFDTDRWPFFSLMFLGAIVLAIVNISESLPRRLVVLSGFWLALFFGRDTWGHLISLAAIPTQFHLNRLQPAFELSAVLLTAWALALVTRWSFSRNRVTALIVVPALGLAFLGMGTERARYLNESAVMGRYNLSAYDLERSDLEASIGDVQNILAMRPGRTFAGLDGSGTFTATKTKIGYAPLYSFLTRHHLDQASFLYHSMSLTSDIMLVKRDTAAFDDLFAIRAILASDDVKPPSYWRLRGSHGRLRVYESSPEGYFSLVDIGGCYDGPLQTFFDTNSQWLNSPLVSAGIVLALERRIGNPGCIQRFEPLPPVDTTLLRPRGQIISESRDGEVRSAEIIATRLCYALVKITWFPDLVAKVDGRRVEMRRVTPGFGAIALEPGKHHIEIMYAPGTLKPALFVVGIALVTLCATGFGIRQLDNLQAYSELVFERVFAKLQSPRVLAGCALAAMIILAGRPLFRGQLINGSDATLYPSRLVEFANTLKATGQLPPTWAADFDSGYGLPLFEFTPPLFYSAAVLLREVGFSSIDSIQFAAAFFLALGAIALYRLARLYHANRIVALVTSGIWLFGSQLGDLYDGARFAQVAGGALVPVALLAFERMLRRPSLRRGAVAAVLISLIPLTNSAVALLVFPVLIALLLSEVAMTNEPRRTTRIAAGAIAGGAGLSAFFWIPAIFDSQLVNRAASSTGPAVAVLGSYSLILIAGAVGVVGLIRGWRSRDARDRARAVVFAGAAVLAGMLVICIPGRLNPSQSLNLAVLMLVLLALPALRLLSPRDAIGLLGLMVLLNIGHTEPKKGYLVFDEEYYTSQLIAARGATEPGSTEYRPRCAAPRTPVTGNRLRGLEGDVAIQTLRKDPSQQVFTATAKRATEMEALTSYYPGWTAAIDGNEVETSACPASGTICFTMPAGRHTVSLNLRMTYIRMAAAIVSLFSLVLVVAATYSRVPSE